MKYGVYILFLFFLIINLNSCKEKKKRGNELSSLIITSNDSINITLKRIINIGKLNTQDTTALVTKNQDFRIHQNLNHLMLCFLVANDTSILFYMGPDMKRNVVIKKSRNNEIIFVFDKNDHVNNFTNIFHKQIIPLFESRLDESAFLELLTKTEDNMMTHLQQLKPHINLTSYKILKSMVTGKITHIKFMHSNRFPALSVHSSYYDFVDNYVFDDDNYLTYSDNLNTVLGVLSKQYERKNDAFLDDADDKFGFINKAIKNNEVKSATIAVLASQIIPEKTNQERTALLTLLDGLTIKDDYLHYIKNIAASTALGKKVGNKAKYLETLISYNKGFSKNLLKGKIIYVDNWASWCGPCMTSMQKFKEKQKILEGINNIVYVFVSFDRTENTWRDYVKKSSLSNHNVIHLYNGMNLNSLYAKFYNISGVPSYLVIDKNGLIYDINPKEPIDNDFESYLKQL